MTTRNGPAASALPPAGALRTLSPAECFDLLEPGGVGRIGFASAAGIIMVPVNFVVAGKTIVFRTAPDTLLAVHANGQVSFEADRYEERTRGISGSSRAAPCRWRKPPPG